MTSGIVEEPRNAALDRAIEAIVASLSSGGTLYACGNGGSAAHADHLVAELVGRFAYDRPPLRAVLLSSGGAVGSCIANDYGWDEVFARQLAGLVKRDDVIVGFSTSGKSRNVRLALHHAWRRCARAVAIVGLDGLARPYNTEHGFEDRAPVMSPVDMSPVGFPMLEVCATSTTTPAIQEQHQAWVHEIARRVEEALCPR